MPIIESVDDELFAFLGPYWTVLKKQNEGKIAIQTILVLWLATSAKNFSYLSEEAKNLIKWGCLFHNIGKQSKPTIYGKDHIYAFNSASKVLDILIKMQILDMTSSLTIRNFSEVQRLIKESRQPLPPVVIEDFELSTPVCTLMQSHHNLASIFAILWDKKLLMRNSFGDLLFRIVLFHQSLAGSDYD